MILIQDDTDTIRQTMTQQKAVLTNPKVRVPHAAADNTLMSTRRKTCVGRPRAETRPGHSYHPLRAAVQYLVVRLLVQVAGA